MSFRGVAALIVVDFLAASLTAVIAMFMRCGLGMPARNYWALDALIMVIAWSAIIGNILAGMTRRRIFARGWELLTAAFRGAFLGMLFSFTAAYVFRATPAGAFPSSVIALTFAGVFMSTLVSRLLVPKGSDAARNQTVTELQS